MELNFSVQLFVSSVVVRNSPYVPYPNKTYVLYDIALPSLTPIFSNFWLICTYSCTYYVGVDPLRRLVGWPQELETKHRNGWCRHRCYCRMPLYSICSSRAKTDCSLQAHSFSKVVCACQDWRPQPSIILILIMNEWRDRWWRISKHHLKNECGCLMHKIVARKVF